VFSPRWAKLFSLKWAIAVFTEVGKNCFHGGRKKLFLLRWAKAVFTEVDKSCFH
jgi:hypothetical protein